MPRYGKVVHHYVYTHDGLNKKGSLTGVKTKQRRILGINLHPTTPQVKIQIEDDPVPEDDAIQGISDQDRDEVLSNAGSITDEETERNREEWYDIQDRIPEEEIQEKIEAMKLENQEAPFQLFERVEPVVRDLPASVNRNDDKTWNERENWIRMFAEISHELMRFSMADLEVCHMEGCSDRGVWRCIDCDIGKINM